MEGDAYHSPFTFVEVKTEAPDEIFDEEDNFVKTEIDEYNSNGEENGGDSEDAIVKEEEAWLENVGKEGIKRENANDAQEELNKSDSSCDGESSDSEKHVQSKSRDESFSEKCGGKSAHDGRELKCHLCGKVFLHRSSLNRHVRAHTSPVIRDKPCECELCGKRFGQKFHLTRHSLVHKDQLRFECELCLRRFGCQDSLDAHLRAHARAPFKCELCDTTFDMKSLYQKHMLVHKDEKLFKCDLCDKRFVCRSYLNRHVLIHSGNGFGCELCGKSFNRKWTLDRHLLVHTGEKPFKCTMCARSFNQRSSLGRHVLMHADEKCSS